MDVESDQVARVSLQLGDVCAHGLVFRARAGHNSLDPSFDRAVTSATEDLVKRNENMAQHLKQSNLEAVSLAGCSRGQFGVRLARRKAKNGDD